MEREETFFVLITPVKGFSPAVKVGENCGNQSMEAF